MEILQNEMQIAVGDQIKSWDVLSTAWIVLEKSA